jgi:hypothetical protein
MIIIEIPGKYASKMVCIQYDNIIWTITPAGPVAQQIPAKPGVCKSQSIVMIRTISRKCINGGIEFKMRIGLNLGHVVVGSIGDVEMRNSQRVPHNLG